MDWLTNNPIANMPGPQFLLFYAGVIAVTLIACWLAVRRPDATATLPVPLVPSLPDPYELAYLRGGENEVVRLAILDLMSRGYLQATDEKEQRIQRAPNHPHSRHLLDIERIVFDCFPKPRRIPEVFEDPRLLSKVGLRLTRRLKHYCSTFEQRLASEQLLMPAEAQQAASNIRRVAVGVIIGLGGYKLLVALLTGHFNVFFLILMAIFAILLLGDLCRPARLSSRGRAFVRHLQLAFEQLKDQRAQLAIGDPSLLLLVSLFGFGALAGTPYDYYRQIFPRAASGGGSCGGGCGSCGGGGGCGGCGD